MRTGRSRLGAALLLSMLTATVWAVAVPGPAAAAGATFRVNVNGDKGDVDIGDGVCDTAADHSTTKCTLRAAIQEANAHPDANTINFKIKAGSSETKTIRPNSPLPTITRPLTIDGYTQPGSSVNTAAGGTNAVIRIELDGRFITEAGLSASAPVVIRGLAIYWFGRGIQLSSGSDGSRIMGNFVGTDASGTEDRGNETQGILVNSQNVRIGSIVRADRNLISGNTQSGINLGIAARRATIQGNLIGTGKNGRKAMSNEGDGIFITGSKGHLVGGQFPGQGNVIARNGGSGVNIVSVPQFDAVATGNRITNDSIFSNGGLGIDLGDDGVTPNDAVPDKDSGPNGLQNFPKLTSAAQVADGTVVAGQLASRRDADFEIQLFASPAGDPEGKTVMSTFVVNTGSDGKASFTRTIASLAEGVLVTATATDVSRTQTSEFSPPRSVTP
jgi:CSLREA domain-containing protein